MTRDNELLAAKNDTFFDSSVRLQSDARAIMIAINSQLCMVFRLPASVDHYICVKNISASRGNIRCFVRGIQELLRRWSLLC
jgi:hypothetical protein